MASGQFSALVHALTGKTTPVDADEDAILDSAASFALKKVSWANRKATLKSYFDTLYEPVGGGGGGGLVLIERQTLAAPAASVTFSGIPGTYGALMHDWQGRIDANTIVVLNQRFNGDTGNNYDQHFATFPTSVGASTAAQSSVRIGTIGGGSAQTANRANAGRVTIPNYAGTTFHKSLLFHANRWDTANDETEMGSGDWRNTAAITSITIFPGSDNFIVGSVFSLYGLP